jgi:hypothetical protein
VSPLSNSFRYLIFLSSRRLGIIGTLTLLLSFPFFSSSQHKNKVYVIDKTENNPARVNGHPAWAVSYDIETNNFRAQDIVSNTFCAGGTALGNGSYLNVGGNAAVTALGVGVAPGGPNSYGSVESRHALEDPRFLPVGPRRNIDGGKAIRMITPCDDDSCTSTTRYLSEYRSCH